jgi:diacylglycerol kinase (ATP)
MASEDNVQNQDQEEFDDTILGTAKIDPDQHSPGKSNPDRIASLKYSIAGLIYMFRHEQSIKALSIWSLTVVVLVVWLPVGSVAAALVLLSVGLVWMGEFLNSAVEAVVDLSTEDIHPMAKIAKDVAASAVLVGVVIMIIVMVLILGPPLLEQLDSLGKLF